MKEAFGMTDSQQLQAADVQAELQNYLNSKNINALFIAIVENLLIEKPANPIAFIIEYLHKQYPDQSKIAFEAILGSSGISAVLPDASKIQRKSVVVADDSDEDDADDFDEPAEDEAVVKKKSRGRKGGISAESVDPQKLKAQRANIVNIPKNPEVSESLLRVVGKSPLLRTLDSEQKGMLINAFSGPIQVEAGKNIILQGEIGDVFYLLEEGLVDVFISKGGSDEMKVHTYKPSDAFGELAIMYNAPRAATCRAQTPCKLWSLDRISFKVIVVAASMLKREIYKGFLQEVKLLETLNELEIMTLADSLAEEVYEEGQIVCTQGEEGEFFYIVKEGKVDCTQIDADGKSKLVATITVGNYFGEIALLTSKPRQATVKASGGKLSVLCIDRATFIRVLGPLEDLLKRNMEEYTKIAARELV